MSFCFPPSLLHTHSQNRESARVLGEDEQLVRQQERQKVFREYRSQRQAVLQLRNADRELRNKTKLQQLEMAEQWQVNSWFSLEIYFHRYNTKI